jgi:methylase of polypeptide subunit release factors
MKVHNLGEIGPDIYDKYIKEIGCKNTSFVVPRDTDAFCRLAELAVEAGDAVVDLGCGDGIATIHAFTCGAYTVLGIDNNEEAILNIQANAALVEANRNTGSIHVTKADMCDFLSSGIHRQNILQKRGLAPEQINLVMSNPPYIPIAEKSAKNSSTNGGPDGLRFISKLLAYASDHTQKIAWLQGSYSSPIEVLEALAKSELEITHLIAIGAQFGDFSIKNYDHLNNLRSEGKGFFWGSLTNIPWYLIMGFVVRPISSNYDWTAIIHSFKTFLSDFSSIGPSFLLQCDRDMPFETRVGIYQS